MSACIEVESEPLFSGELARIEGPLVDDTGFMGSGALCSLGTHSFTIDRGAELGRARFSWTRDDVDLAVDLAGPIVVDQASPAATFEGASFVVRDERGLAIAVNAGSLADVDGAHVEHGYWRGSTPTACGLASVTTTLVTIDGVVTELANGEVKPVTIDGAELQFHAFVASTLGPWWCTDSADALNWAIVR